MPSVPDSPEPLAWFKSSYSGANTTECVEAAHLPQATAIRDSKAPDGPMLTFGNPSWAGFLTAVRHQKLSKEVCP
ncbi:DUF397 domain-containing protein [Streptomyces sp. NBC_01242]|uniref:DUF397 domain-containing protein n=1 Tax=Streptomyces sp. NBC_01242 TaxID=2903795 RepID=UPI00225744EB|nr:DUF397 domain-containing protein [Streptomyces sp. NBC_01242]MCX4797287.1 DUF397 domain-containing protein [Streptomyces sp. NBC_01242]